MELKCRKCGRYYEVEEKTMAKIRPSSYLCPDCRDKGEKIGVGIGAGLLIFCGAIYRFFIKRK